MGEILLTGARGMLGRAWARTLDARGRAYRALNRPDFDLARPETIEACVVAGTHTVINCAAWTDVDGAEADPDGAAAVNGHGVGKLAARCREVGATLVHYSTDYVFDGAASEPYTVDHPHAPINAYGRSKDLGERLLVESGCAHLLIRTSWVYAPWGKNFVLTMARLGREKESLRVVHDQRGRPTSAEHLARVSCALLERGARGTFHVSDGGECSWFELAKHVVEHVNPSCRVDPCSSEEYPRPARRPAYSVLDLAVVEKLVGAMAPWRDNVTAVLAQLEAAP